MPRRLIGSILSLIILIYLYFLMEWLFFVTKDSFLQYIPFLSALRVLVVAPLIAVLPALVIFAILWILSVIAKRSEKFIYGAISLLSATLTALLTLILLENFTYTLFKFTILRVINDARFFYGLLFFNFVVLSWRWIFKKSIVFASKPILIFTTITVVISLFWGTYSYRVLTPVTGKDVHISSSLPNIFIIGSDAIRADHLAIYGYHKNTTPFLKSISDQLLIAQNAFSNANRTYGALTALLSGKTGLETDVVGYPHLLGMRDSFANLPAILKKLGYTSAQFTSRKFADAFDANFRDGFDFVNYRDIAHYRLPFISWYQETYSSLEFYFALQVFERAQVLFLHIFGLVSPEETLYELVSYPLEKHSDNRTLQNIANFIASHNEPVFVHSHLLGTHLYKYLNGGHNENEVRELKNEFDSDETFDIGRYDSAIQNFDSQLKWFFDFLSKTGKLEKSIIVVYSDHDPGYHIGVKVPLIIRFPNEAHTGNFDVNTQLIDVAPTILDFLGIATPNWLEGKSILMLRDTDKARRIYSVSDLPKIAGIDTLLSSRLNTVGIVVCDNRYALTLSTHEIAGDKVGSYKGRCKDDELPDQMEIRTEIFRRIR